MHKMKTFNKIKINIDIFVSNPFCMKNVLGELLNKIALITEQLKPDEYSEVLPILMQNSIGKHIRHILDLVECLCNSSGTGEINYDARRRDNKVEASPEYTLAKINFLLYEIEKLDVDSRVLLKQKIANEEIEIESQINREILYNIEHCVHHLAIIRIGIEQNFPHINFPKNFGIAYSTVYHREKGEA